MHRISVFGARPSEEGSDAVVLALRLFLPESWTSKRAPRSRDVLITIIKSNGRRVSVHWFVGVLQSLCSLS
jgi:hypothetical protein